MRSRDGLAPWFAPALGAMAVWIVALGLAPVVRAQREAWPPAWRAMAGLVYVAGSHVCHQRPERSFPVAGAPLPVPLPICARCVGLHTGAALGLAAFVLMPGAWRRRLGAHARGWLAAAALPTVASVGLEWAGGPSSLWSRTIAALPFGACAAMLLGLALAGLLQGRAAPGSPQPSATLR
jgi:hypothetical protein